MLSANQKISLRQLQMLMVLDVFGTGVIVLPRRAAEYAGQDGWMIIIGLTALAMLCAALITAVARRFPNESFISYTGRLISKPAALLLGTVLLIKILVGVSLELRLFGAILQETLLPKTPLPVVCAVMLSAACYAAAKGIETRARVGEILFFVMLIPLVLLFIIALTDIDLTQLLPVFTTPPAHVLAGTAALGFALTGLEFILLAFPYLQHPQQGRRSVLQAVAFIGALLLCITLTTLAKFGPDDILAQKWPVLKMMDMLKIPGSFIERQDALIMSFWIISVFAIVNASLFYASILLKDLLKRGESKFYALGCAAVVFGLALLPWRVEDIYKGLDYLYYWLGAAFLSAVPLLLWITALIRKAGKPV